jgi:hypothetical protein
VYEKFAAAENLYTTGFAMFVRWQRRKRRSRAFGLGRGADIHWAAILAESTRIHGRPRQQHIAYLGGITNSAIEIVAQRALFWQEVGQRLDNLANRTSNKDRMRIEEAIAKKVPRLTRVEYDECFARWTALDTDDFSKPSFQVCGIV